jgi:CP family cyanate transporter-like MFS transporter
MSGIGTEAEAPGGERRAVWLLWLSGIALRLTILAVPPVLELIRADLALSGTQIGILTGLPVVLFAVAALPGALLISRFGAFATLIIGIMLTAVGGALRGAASGVLTLYATTIVMGMGIAVMQPALPPLVRQWAPRRIGFVTAIYTNGLLVGEILPVALTVPILLPLFGGGWRLGLALWSIPTVAIALIVAWFAPRAEAQSAVAVRPRWWPDWRDGLMWRLGLVLAGANTVYFGTNAFLPGYLAFVGRSDLISPALTALNVGQIPVSFLLLGFARWTERRIWPFLLAGAIMLIGLVGLVSTAGAWAILFAGCLGFSAAGVLALSLSLPPLLCAPDDVGRMAAAMFTIGYAVAVILSVLGGIAWDIATDARFAFLPIALAVLAMLVCAPTIGFKPLRRR